mgnify:FL=1
MRKLFFSFFVLLILSACSQRENIDVIEDEEEGEVLSIQDVKIPDVIFTSEKQNSVIDEEEMKLSIKTYLDSFEELSIASEPFQDYIDEELTLTVEEQEKFKKIRKLAKENDKNFSNYILNNTLPEGYQEEAERISQYITSFNELLAELSIISIIDKGKVMNGKEQKKIEDFLDRKKINTKAFGRQS